MEQANAATLMCKHLMSLYYKLAQEKYKYAF